MSKEVLRVSDFRLNSSKPAQLVINWELWENFDRQCPN